MGQCKRDYMGLQRPPEVMAVLEQVQRRDSVCASLFRLTDAVQLWLCVCVWQMKRLFDPHGILNPYKGVAVRD